ncbi:uncharacterized protein LOC112888372 isoform X3 [Panicum hallii]|uniref:uncharacterized protein LOC112888372 isoform X3 n=1 Tax=Panicum hallii TaxID=206008 RepID=UPI000DF4E763|nr:uncharacterized protein LOC112888372 isoform X3 [Panicum hallii]
MAYGLWPRFAISPRRPRGPPPPPDRVVPSLVATRLASSSLSTCLCPPPPTPRPARFPLRPREALASLRYRRRRRLGASAPRASRRRSQIPISFWVCSRASPRFAVSWEAASLAGLQSDLVEFLYQQHCNFLQYRKAIAVFHLLNCRRGKSRTVKAESVASDVTCGFDK